MVRKLEIFKGLSFKYLHILGVPIIKDSTDYWSAKDDQKIEVNCTINSLSSVQINWWFETCIRNIHIWPNCGNSTTVVSKQSLIEDNQLKLTKSFPGSSTDWKT